jgi:hypothetical protein
VGKLRSLLIKVEIDTAQRAHKCQANARHEIKRGDPRLNVRTGRGWDRYCLDRSLRGQESESLAVTEV